MSSLARYAIGFSFGLLTGSAFATNSFWTTPIYECRKQHNVFDCELVAIPKNRPQ